MVNVFDILIKGNSSVEFKLKLYVKTSIQTSRKNNAKHKARKLYLKVLPHCAREILQRNNHNIFCSVCARKARSWSDKSRDYRWNHRVRKVLFSNCFTSSLERKVSVFKFLLLKASFSWRNSVDWRPNQRQKVAFPNLSGVVWRGLIALKFYS